MLRELDEKQRRFYPRHNGKNRPRSTSRLGNISPVYRVIPQQAGKRTKERRLEFEDSLGSQLELARRSAVPSQSRFYQPTTISSFANAICHKQSETYS